MSAVLHSAGVEIHVQRPPGSKSREKTDYMTPADAAAIIAAADASMREFGLLLRFLLYTGVRIGEALGAALGGHRDRDATSPGCG